MKKKRDRYENGLEQGASIVGKIEEKRVAANSCEKKGPLVKRGNIGFLCSRAALDLVS